jgi:hypothetical protein
LDGEVRFDLADRVVSLRTLEATPLRRFTQLRKIQNGFASVAEAPTDADFDAASVWRIAIPADIELTPRRLLRVSYVGDVARVYVGGELVTDDFYHGRPLEISLRELADRTAREIELRILPLQKNVPIYLDRRAKPDFENTDAIARIDRIEIIEQVD